MDKPVDLRIGLYAVLVVMTLLAACSEKTLAPDIGSPLSTVTPASSVARATPQGVLTPTAGVLEVQYGELREQMVDRTIASRGVSNKDVLRVMGTVPRHAFVLPDNVNQAYDDHPLPIGYGQTISQPYMVAWMTELLGLEAGDKVLEIGTGSGYQAAVLAELGDIDVYTIEIVPELAAQAAEKLEKLGYAVHVKEGNGYFGWEENAPYDAIIVTAAPDHLPQSLVQQLVDGGTLVIPIGPPGGYQSLWQFEKTGDSVQARNLGGVAFVPFTGGGVGQSEPVVP